MCFAIQVADPSTQSQQIARSRGSSRGQTARIRRRAVVSLPERVRYVGREGARLAERDRGRAIALERARAEGRREGDLSDGMMEGRCPYPGGRRFGNACVYHGRKKQGDFSGPNDYCGQHRRPSSSASSSSTSSPFEHWKHKSIKSKPTKKSQDTSHSIHNHWYPSPPPPPYQRRSSTFSDLSSSTVHSIRRSLHIVGRGIRDVGGRTRRIEQKRQPRIQWKYEDEHEDENDQNRLRRMAMGRLIRCRELALNKGASMPVAMAPFDLEDVGVGYAVEGMRSPWEMAKAGPKMIRGRW